MAGGGRQGGDAVISGPLRQHPGPGQMEAVGDHHHPLGQVTALCLQQLPGIAQVLVGVVGPLLQKQPVLLHPPLHQVVRHAPGLGDGLVVPLAPGDHHRQVRVALQVVQRPVQPVPQKDRGRPVGHHLAAQHHHRPGVPLDMVVGAVEHRAEQPGKGHGPCQHRRQQQLLPQTELLSFITADLPLHPLASSSSADRRSQVPYSFRISSSSASRCSYSSWSFR